MEEGQVAEEKKKNKNKKCCTALAAGLSGYQPRLSGMKCPEHHYPKSKPVKEVL